MEHFLDLINLVDTSIKDNIKEGEYIKLMMIISQIYKIKASEQKYIDSSDDEQAEQSNNVYGDYNDIYSD